MYKNKTRLNHIDAIRGLMMLLVVYGHTFFFLTPEGNTKIIDIFLYFRMPLFFFIAGFFLYSENYSIELFKHRGINRIIRQFYPTIILWGLFCIIYTNEASFKSFLTPYKAGYWFTYVSVEMFFIIAPLLVFFTLKKYSRIKKIIFLISLCLIFLTLLYGKFFPKSLSGFLSFDLIAMYLPYLVFGMIAKMYYGYFSKITYSALGIITTVAILAITVFFKNQGLQSPLISIPLPYLVAFSCIIITFSLFSFIYNKTSLGMSRLMKGLTFIGTCTLEIYLLHYFIIFGLKNLLGNSHIFNMLDSIRNTPIEFPITMTISVIIAGGCLGIVNCFKKIRVHKFIFPSTPPLITDFQRLKQHQFVYIRVY